jgi:hypothetical protein
VLELVTLESADEESGGCGDAFSPSREKESALAIVMYQLVEVPTNNLGHALAERAALRPTPVAGAVLYRVRFSGLGLCGGIRPSDLRQ